MSRILSVRDGFQKRTGSINPSDALVLGGAGFFGSHLCERLLKEGFSVACIDNFSTGRRSNIAHLVGRPDFTAVHHDIRLPFKAEAPLIFNLASPASPIDYQRDPIGTLTTNVVGAINCLNLARRNHAVVVQASTSEVYGDPFQHPQREGYWGNVNPIGPRACYDEGKRSAETLFFDYHRMHQLKIKVIRIFNTYGPRMRLDDGRVVSNFIVQALKNEDITIYGDGLQTRSLCYVDDLVEGFIRMSRSGDHVTGPTNLGNPVEYPVLQLAQIIRELTGSRSRIIHLTAAVDDPRQRRPDISKAQLELGWQPTIPVQEGIRRTVSYFESLLKKTNALHSAVEVA